MNHPVMVSPEGREYNLVVWACGLPKLNWEWYGFEKVNDDTYFGYVMGFENEFGYFSISELRQNGIKLVTDINDLDELMPPVGWTKKCLEVTNG